MRQFKDKWDDVLSLFRPLLEKKMFTDAAASREFGGRGLCMIYGPYKSIESVCRMCNLTTAQC